MIEMQSTSEYNMSTDGECSIIKLVGPDNIISDGILVFIINKSHLTLLPGHSSLSQQVQKELVIDGEKVRMKNL
ncbi:MAG: hypothetical protein K8R25_16110 [Methanosarcinales archaeon]|nr:hypothetical protein [Methanosarcinales archaeon]